MIFISNNSHPGSVLIHLSDISEMLPRKLLGNDDYTQIELKHKNKQLSYMLNCTDHKTFKKIYQYVLSYWDCSDPGSLKLMGDFRDDSSQRYLSFKKVTLMEDSHELCP